MGVAKFIDSVKEFLGLDKFINQFDKLVCEKSDKKKLVKSILKKLKEEEKKIGKSLKKRLIKKEKRELEEELKIISLLIKKGEKILDKKQ
ncbi:MAG: hypothetical protein KAQ94_03030 [Arcobacteraceae bacterium]|nr:hypothetical protein [Arcobacteraceae bacterium]